LKGKDYNHLPVLKKVVRMLNTMQKYLTHFKFWFV